jgi:G3E family GTPase
MRLLILTGFFGSGKTTFLLRALRLATCEAGLKVVLVQNELGKVGVDPEAFLAEDLAVKKLLGGCICCNLATQLLGVLHSLDEENAADLVCIEASGIATPGMVRDLLAGTSFAAMPLLQVNVLDAARLERIEKVLSIPALCQGIETSDICVVNKIDAAPAGFREAFHARVGEIRPDAEVYFTNLYASETLPDPLAAALWGLFRAAPGEPDQTPRESDDGHHHHHHDHHNRPSVCAREIEIPSPVPLSAATIHAAFDTLTASIEGTGGVIGHVKAALVAEDGTRYFLNSTGVSPREVGPLPEDARISRVVVNAIAWKIEQALLESHTSQFLGTFSKASRKTLPLSLGFFAMLAAVVWFSGCQKPVPQPGKLVSGFEEPGAWTTAPLAEIQAVPADKLSTNARSYSPIDPMVKPMKPEELAAGAGQVRDHVTEGKFAIKWDRHPLWPTLRSTQVPADWSGAAAVSLDIFSEAATGEIVTVAFAADSAGTPFRDWWYLPVTINWSGAKTLVLPLDAFQKAGSPDGWKAISAIGLFAKMRGTQPHPATSLTLDNLRMLDQAPPGDEWKTVLAKFPDARDADGFYYKVREKDQQVHTIGEIGWQRDQLNHTGPETAGNRDVFAPYAHQNLFAAERALFDYYPKFLPGYVSFDPRGKAYIFSRDWIEWKGADGRWEYSDLRPVLTQWAKEKGWEGISLGWNINEGEKAIRFDKDGDAYVLATLTRTNKAGTPVDARSFVTLLLRSRDQLRTWEVHDLGTITATFEKMDGHNQECLDRPPVMITGDLKGRAGSDQGAYLLLPRKNPDGTLTIPPRVKFSDFSISVPVHSGDGNMAISCGGKIFIVYAWWTKALAGKALAGNADPTAQLPPVPPDHPGLKQVFKNGTTAEYAKDGTPVFIVEYDPATGVLGQPVYIMSGGFKMDNHNWPAITVDSKGILHVLANGHQNPINYSRSLAPFDIRAWTPPQYVANGLPDGFRLSYATLNCDREDNLYSINRNSTLAYNNRLSLFFKPAGKDWQPAQTLVMPFNAGYKNWGHKMGYNPATDQLCLSFYSQSNLRQLWADTYAADLFIWPDREPEYYTGKKTADGLSLNTGSPQQQDKRDFSYAMSWADEPVSLITTCPDGRWKLATSADFQ